MNITDEMGERSAIAERDHLKTINAELLEALQSSLKFVEAWQTEYLDKDNPQRICVDEQIKKARAAIARATGKE